MKLLQKQTAPLLIMQSCVGYCFKKNWENECLIIFKSVVVQTRNMKLNLHP